MYRVRAEAVSGIKVFADGKWLTCIGNKPVHVGDLIWTDGRCVYGNFQEAQQPLIITAPTVDEAIPIVTTEGFYLFRKGKLKTIPTTENAPLLSYNEAFVNNEKGKSFLCIGFYPFPAGAVYKSSKDTGTGEESAGFMGGFFALVAANVDKSGNLFRIFLNDLDIEIWKNDTKLTEIDLRDIIEEVASGITQPSAPALPPSGNGQLEEYINHIYGKYIEFEFEYSFIENEENWFVAIAFYGRAYSSSYFGDPAITVTNYCDTRYYLDNHGISHDPMDEILERANGKYVDPPYEITIISESHPETKLRNFPLQDGFYFTEEVKYEIWDSDGTTYERTRYERKIFSPTNELIFTGCFKQNSCFIFRKVKGGYLMIVSHGAGYAASSTLPNLDMRYGYPYFNRGIFFFNSEQWFILRDFTLESPNPRKLERCLNQKLIPMTKIKNFHKRIREISLEE